MLLSHTPTGAAAPALVFCAHLPVGQQHQPATRAGAAPTCPHPCRFGACPLQRGACTAPPAKAARLALALGLPAGLLAAQGAGRPASFGFVLFQN